MSTCAPRTFTPVCQMWGDTWAVLEVGKRLPQHSEELPLHCRAPTGTFVVNSVWGCLNVSFPERTEKAGDLQSQAGPHV